MIGKNKCILLLSGGSMRGVFGAGVVNYLEEIDFYKNIEAVYANSAGVFNGCYFLSRQTELGPSIYSEELTSGFIKPFTQVIYGFLQRLGIVLGHKISTEKLRDGIDADFLFEILKHRKILNVERIKSQMIPLYARLWNVDSGKSEYMDVRSDTFWNILRASATLIPYTHELVKIKKHRYMEGGLINLLGIDDILERHPDRKIVVVLSGKTESFYAFRHRFRNRCEKMISMAMFPDGDFSALGHSYSNTGNDLKKIKKNPNIYFINIPDNLPITSYTQNKKILLRAYAIGRERAKKIPEFLKT